MTRKIFIYNNIHVLRGLDSDSIDVIACDPPFNSNENYNSIDTTSRKSKQEFKDRWRWDEVTKEWYDLLADSHPAIKDLIKFTARVVDKGNDNKITWKISIGDVPTSMAAYLCYMAPRLIEMRRVLKNTGSIFLHCDATANSYLRLLMDAIFGNENCKNELIWSYSGGGRARKKFPAKHDTILFYSKTDKAIFNPQYLPYPAKHEKLFKHTDENGRYRWIQTPNKKKVKNYMGEGILVRSVFTDIDIVKGGKEKVDYPTQKPVKLSTRLIKAVVPNGAEDFIVLDPFCGSGTTLVAAEENGCSWIGVDMNDIDKLVCARLNAAAAERKVEADYSKLVEVKRTAPKRKIIGQKLTDNQLKEILFQKQGRKCANPTCDSKELKNFELDHVIPKRRGGSDAPENRIALCSNCNKRKRATAWGEFFEKERNKVLRKDLKEKPFLVEFFAACF